MIMIRAEDKVKLMMCHYVPYWKIHSLSNYGLLVMQPTNLSGVPFGNETGSTILDWKGMQTCVYRLKGLFNVELSARHSSAWMLTPACLVFILLPWSACTWVTNWKIIRSVVSIELYCAIFPPWKFVAETTHAFGIPNCVTPTPHAFKIPVQETPLSIRIPRCYPW